MSKHPHPPNPGPQQPRAQEPEPEWLVFAIRRVPGTYETSGGWELRAGKAPEGRIPPLETHHHPNLLAVILGHVEHAIMRHREHDR
jgi:hypothetical protein